MELLDRLTCFIRCCCRYNSEKIKLNYLKCKPLLNREKISNLNIISTEYLWICSKLKLSYYLFLIVLGGYPLKEIVITLAEIVNNIHDLLTDMFGLHMSDKQLHFWVIGIIGMATFFIVYFFFKIIEKMKWSTAITSFIYTFTIMVVLVFAIELQQAITNRGNMEFADAVMGLWGFIVLFMIYAVLAILIYFIFKTFKKKK